MYACLNRKSLIFLKIGSFSLNIVSNNLSFPHSSVVSYLIKLSSQISLKFLIYSSGFISVIEPITHCFHFYGFKVFLII